MNLLILGASGDLGRPLSTLAACRYKTVGTYYRHPEIGGGQPIFLDVCDRAAVRMLAEQVRPDAIIHLAVSDRSPNMLTAIPLGAGHVAKVASALGVRLIVLSTDMVFDCRCPPYAENDLPAPLNEYGGAKAHAERLTLKICPDALVVRTSLIYDLDPRNRQVGWMLSAIADGHPVTLFEDEIRQPIWAYNLAEALLELITLDVTGILHVAGGVPMNRWDYGCALLRALGYDPEVVAVRIRAAEVAPHRPRNCTLRLDRARAVLKTSLLTVSEALRASPSPPQPDDGRTLCY